MPETRREHGPLSWGLTAIAIFVFLIVVSIVGLLVVLALVGLTAT
jgi:hypothetical protein